ncbi:MAG: NYN domain-containing protein, partial [Chloroflexia bacterium]
MAGWWLWTSHGRDEGQLIAWQMVAELGPEYPTLNRILTHALQIEPGAEAALETYRREFDSLTKSLDLALGPRQYRGVALARKIHTDNVEQYFAPLRRALSSSSESPARIAHRVRVLSGRELVDRHPDQQTNIHPIEANLRVQLINDRDSIIQDLLLAAELRAKIEALDEQGREDTLSFADEHARRLLSEVVQQHESLEWAVNLFLLGEPGETHSAQRTDSSRPGSVSLELLSADARHALAAPKVLAELRFHDLDLVTFVRLFVRDLARGLSPDEWAEWLIEAGAVGVAADCWRAAGLEADREEVLRNARADWTGGLEPRVRDIRAALGGGMLDLAARRRLEPAVQEIEHLIRSDWIDLALHPLKRAEELMGELLAERRRHDDSAEPRAVEPPMKPYDHAAGKALAPTYPPTWVEVLRNIPQGPEGTEPPEVEPTGAEPATHRPVTAAQESSTRAEASSAAQDAEVADHTETTHSDSPPLPSSPDPNIPPSHKVVVEASLSPHPTNGEELPSAGLSPGAKRPRRRVFTRSTSARRTALFVDWENLKYSLREHDEAPDTKALMESVKRFGRVVVARAYADWQEYDHRLNFDARRLYHAGIEPVYVPVRTRY